MQTEQHRWTVKDGWTSGPPNVSFDAQWVLVFGDRDILRQNALYEVLRKAYPHAFLMGCSTSGEIAGSGVFDGGLMATAIRFDAARVEGVSMALPDLQHSRAVGEQLGRSLSRKGLVHVFVLSEGLDVNGAELVAGFRDALPPQVRITGGLAGDGTRFQQTAVWANSPAEPHRVVAVGLYGDSLRVCCGSFGGWDPFGPERLITASKNNVLLELDGQNALALYKSYLGTHAKQLPGSGLSFPLSVRAPSDRTGVGRILLEVNDADQSMTFAGNMPVGHFARFMKAHPDRLVDGAGDAGMKGLDPRAADLAILVSCVGRKMLLKERVAEEIAGIRHRLGERVPITGFYSYGQISPLPLDERSELHNQTMTVTTLCETRSPS